MKQKLGLTFPSFCNGRGISSCIQAFCEHFESETFTHEYWTPAIDPVLVRPYHRVSVPGAVSRVLYRYRRSEAWLNRLHERRFLAALRPGDVAYLWPASSVELFETCKRRGYPVVMEQINSHMAVGKRLMDEAFERLGMRIAHAKTAEAIELEERRLAAADRIFSCSPFVRRSLEAEGVPAEKILDCSYGWDPVEFRPKPKAGRTLGGPTFLCVCYGSVRKGLPQLLEYWAAAEVGGKLLLVGGVDDDVRAVADKHLRRPDVHEVPFTMDLAAIYQSADAFVLCSHEEGSPLVTYLALASGLPCLVSPAAGSGIVRNGVEGFLREPYERDAWVEALTRLAQDEELCNRMSEAARLRSLEFTWARVTARRTRQLEQAFAGAASVSA